MTLDTSAMVVQWPEAIARGGHRAYSIPVVEMVALLDALDAERERVRVCLKLIENMVEDLDSGASYQAVKDMLIRFLKEANP